MSALIAAMGGGNGDLLLFAADKNTVVWDVLGALRLELARQMELLDKSEYKFLWVTEFPLLEWSEEQGRYTAKHHPFTMPMEEDLGYIDSDLFLRGMFPCPLALIPRTEPPFAIAP